MSAEFDSGAFVRTPAWHQLGVVLPDYLPPSEMQTAAGLDWEVDLHPVYASYKVDGRTDVVEIPDKNAVLRQDTNSPLGIVGDRYELIQNTAVFDFLEALVDSSDVKIETAGSLKDGRWVWAQAKVGDDLSIADDKHGQYLTVATSHDGTLAFTAYPTFVRIVCANTFSAAYKSKTIAYKVRHTRNSKMLVAEARQALEFTFKDGEQFARDVERLMNQPLTVDGFVDTLDKMLPLPDEDDNPRLYTMRSNERAGIVDLYTQSSTVIPWQQTAWGFVNAVNEWEQWGRGGLKNGESKPERTVRQFLAGSGSTLTNHALAILGATAPTK